MSATALPLDRDAMRLLAEIGFMGTVTGPVAAARSLFESLQILRPDSKLPWIGLALGELGAGRPEEAVRLLRDEALRLHPGDAESLTFLGMALQKAGRASEARKVLASVIDQEGAEAEPHVRMATKLMVMAGGTPEQARPPMPAWSEMLRATR